MDKNNSLQFDLLDIVKTKEDRVLFLAQLDGLSKSFFSHEKDYMNLLEKYLPYGRKEKLLQIAQKNKIAVSDEQALQAFLEKIKNTVASLPEIMITLAFAPTQEVISTISSWFALHLKQAILLDVVVDKTVIGGAIIGYQGKHKDFSLRKKMKEKYANGEIRLLNSNKL